MAALKAYSVGRLAKYVTESALRNIRPAVNRSTAAYYSTEEKPAVDSKPELKLPATLEESHREIETLSEQLANIRVQAKDYEDKYKRALADGENTRKRMIKQVEDTKSFAIQSFCKDLLDVADTLTAAAESVPEGAGGDASLRALADGVRLTRAMLTQVFARHGLEEVSPLRQKFDPNLHEALFQQEVEGAEPGTVVAVSKIGYKLHGRCVRPALVGVAKS